MEAKGRQRSGEALAHRPEILTAVRAGDWTTAAGYLLCVAMLTGGYYYNLTFVQLGLIDLARRRIGMDGAAVAGTMALFALGALAAALGTGRTLDRLGGVSLRRRMQALTLVVAVQTALTWWAPFVDTPALLSAWTLLGSISLGVGIPITFGLVGNLIPVADRGLVAATIAGASFALAALYPRRWVMDEFSRVLLVAMIPACLVLGAMAFGRLGLLDRMDRPTPPGRFRSSGSEAENHGWGFATLVALMFAVFFIDSLGFLRLIEIPAFIASAWQSPGLGPRLFIAAVHVIGAAIGGVLYSNFEIRWTLLAVFALFGFSHLLYTFHLRFSLGEGAPLVMPMVYVLAVSFYTTVNFAVWPDMATHRDIGRRTAVGVGTAGWLASFLSTSAALHSEATGVDPLTHLNLVEALALLLVFCLTAGWFFSGVRRAAAGVR